MIPCHDDNGRMHDATTPPPRMTAQGFQAALLCLLLSGAPAPLQAGSMHEMADLLAHPDQYDKQEVSVVGEVSNLQIATTRDGQTVYGFLLKAGSGTVKVIGMGRTIVRDGEQVVVEGVFNRLRQGGRTAVLNEIKAEAVRPLARLTPDFVG
jgi:hypothetical protein